MHNFRIALSVLALITLLFGSWWLWRATQASTVVLPSPAPSAAAMLKSGMVAAMNSTAFTYSPGWTVSASGADPREPVDPWHEPAGVVTFGYVGDELALALAPGPYWGYLYVTVDERPANLLAVMKGNVDSRGRTAGYRTLYDPERAAHDRPTPQWVRVHQARQAGSLQTHAVRIEVWRSWGQMPLRGVAIDALPTRRPRWPGVLMMLTGGWLLALAMHKPVTTLWRRSIPSAKGLRRGAGFFLMPSSMTWLASWLALVAVALVTLSVGEADWRLCLGGLALLGYASLHRPALWLAALLFGLPFYFSQTLALLPSRSVSIIDIGILGGLLIVGVTSLLDTKQRHEVRWAQVRPTSIYAILALMMSWALISASAAEQTDVALREWRTVFLNAGLFALLLAHIFRSTQARQSDRWLLLGAWLAGGTILAASGLWHYATDTMLISAEGVYRVRGFYGSPNNLALYLERTLALSLALALFGSKRRWRLLWGLSSALQLGALLLTFSKGGIFLALPAMMIILWVGGLLTLRQRGESTRQLWGLAGLALLVAIVLLPFTATERFQRLLDFSQGTGFIRIQLWRSAWQMALDHLLLGVGPDNFLYTYRSQYILPNAWQEPNLNHPHNLLLDWGTRLGVPGLLLAFALFMKLFLQLWKNLRSARNPLLSLGLLAATAAALAHGLIDTSYALPDLMLVWVFILVMAHEERGESILR